MKGKAKEAAGVRKAQSSGGTGTPVVRRAVYALMAVCGLMTGMAGGGAAGSSAFAASDTRVSMEEAAFPDVTETDWFYPYVTRLAEDGYVKGRDTGLYDPQGKLTAAEASAMIVRYLGLESDAAQRADRLKAHNRAGSELWYAGYIQIMYEAGLVSPEEYSFTDDGAEVVLGDSSRFGEYITREAFVRMIVGSFALEETQIRSETPLDPSGVGHDFETPYTYTEQLANAYAKAINDFESIPEHAREAVLRAYMNGIFQGDHAANFNPYSQLTRAEMAKVITVILHKEMRTWADVSLPTFAEVGNDGDILPNTELTDGQIDGILEAALADARTVKNKDGTGDFEFCPQFGVPTGYALKIYHFVNAGGGYDADLALPLNNDGSNYYRCAFFGGDRIVLALENTATGETVGTVLLQLGNDGTLTDRTEQYLP